MVPNQDTDALLEVSLTAWSLTTSITACGGRCERICGGLSELIGFKSRVLSKIYCVLLPRYLTIYLKDCMRAAGLGRRFGL